MRHRLSIGAIVLVAAAVAAGTAAAARSAKIAPPANIASAGKIVYCMDISFPPFESYTAGNKPIGAEVDLGTAFATLMGVKASFRNTAFDGIIPALQASQCDAVISGLYDKASRRKVVDFVDYALLGNSIVVQKGNPRHVTGLDTSLAGLKVGVQAGTTLRLQLIAENTKLKKAGKAQITVVSFPKDSDAFQNLIAGNVDAYYTVTSTAAYYGKKTGGKTEIAGPQVSAFPFGIATRKSDKQLHQAFAKGLAMLRANGQYLAILKRWGVANAALKG
jgi:polar amino acid transport system substrate-binding protein